MVDSDIVTDRHALGIMQVYWIKGDKNKTVQIFPVCMADTTRRNKDEQ